MANISGPDTRSTQEKLNDEIAEAKLKFETAPTDPEETLQSIRNLLSALMRFVELKDRRLEQNLDISGIGAIVTKARDLFNEVMQAFQGQEPDSSIRRLKESIEGDLAYYDEKSGQDISPKGYKPPVDDVYLQTK